MFAKYILDYKTNLFDDLYKSIKFEDITNGRKGAILVELQNKIDNLSIPIVRTTSIYNNPVQSFLPIHCDIIKNINKISNINLSFNNALIETYDINYRNMKEHSDQSLDLADDSYICLFSCYEDSADTNIRKLQIKGKHTDESFEFLLEHNSIILFSLTTNSKYLHKIVLDKIYNKTNNRWLGITFRLSKTFIHFINELPYFSNGNQLTLANDEQKKEFYKLRGKENLNIDFSYPEIYYTISISDTLMILQ